MKIAIDVSPLHTGHRVRGVGFYLNNLKDALLKYHSEYSYVFFNRGDKLPYDVDIVHFPYFEPFFLARPVYKEYKSIVTVHDLTPMVFPKEFPKGIKGWIKWQMQKNALLKTEGIITDSYSSKKDIIKYVGIPEDKISVVYLAAADNFAVLKKDEKLIKEIRLKHKLPERFCLYVGDVTWNKNLPRLIKAIKKTNFPLVMVGQALASKDFDKKNAWNKDLITVQSLAEEDKNIISLGFVSSEELVQIYKMCTVFVMPSLYEGFGLPILEAMASGAPVISSKEGSLSEVCQDAAFFVNAYSEDSIAEGIKKVFNNEKIREELIEKGTKNVLNFSWEKTAAETIQAYKKTLNEK
jgi:glycosyltransferase involved in cell wall biosynthesis